MAMLTPEKRVYVAGHRGMVGSAVVRLLQARGFEDVICRRRDEVDLRNQGEVEDLFANVRPEVVVFAAGRVGGIHANDSRPADFIYDNLAMAVSVIEAARRHDVQRFLYLGSTCIYPREAQQPIREDYLLSGPLERTNEGYAIAKIAGLKLCQFYRRQYGVLFHSAMPTNLYGPGDNYHPENSHVLPALIRRFHEARLANAPTVTIWGSGNPRREFLHVDDLADAVLHLLTIESPPDVLNIGTGRDISIRELAGIVAETVGYQGQIECDPSRPDGTMRKLTDISALEATGWQAQTSLRDGIRSTYESFLEATASETLRT